MELQLPRILLIDDEKDNLDALKRLLRRDYQIDAFLSAEEALEFLKNNKVTLEAVVSDQRMPGMSGSEFFGKLQETHPSPTRILLTGFADLDAIIDAVNRGHIWRYIAKPWEPDDLKLTLKQAVERTHLKRSLKDSNQSLEKAIQRLKAKDWSRERLLKILLHEFRTIPQILEGVLELDQSPDAHVPEKQEAKKSFILSLQNRIKKLAGEIEEVFSDEAKISKLPTENFFLSELLSLERKSDECLFSGPKAEILRCLNVLQEALLKNSAERPPLLSVESVRGPKGGTLFLSFSLQADKPLFPSGLMKQNLEASTAWNALLEPFVGMDDFQHHSTGLRLEISQKIRTLMSLGIRPEFDIKNEGRSVELILSFPID